MPLSRRFLGAESSSLDCLRTGDRWVHLGLCLSCGHVGCCDSSKNKHASAHFNATKHPIIQSFEPGENWKWCYVDETYLRGRPVPLQGAVLANGCSKLK